MSPVSLSSSSTTERARRTFYLVMVGVGCVTGILPAALNEDFTWFSPGYETLVPLVLLALAALWTGFALRWLARPTFEWGLWSVVVVYNASVLLLALYFGLDAHARVFLEAFAAYSAPVYLWSYLAFGRRTGTIASLGFVALTVAIPAPYLAGLTALRSEHDALFTMLITTPGIGIVLLTGVHAISYFLEANVRARVLAEATADLAFYDALTGLPNRRLFDDRLAQAVRVADREGTAFALAFLDIDDFKSINDTLGHGVGDLLLRSVAERLGTVLRESDTVARISGDEFALILPTVRTRAAVDVVAERMRRTMAPPFELDGLRQHVGVSVGFTLYPKHGTSPADLLARADSAMYIAKGEGKGAYRLYGAAAPVEPVPAEDEERAAASAAPEPSALS